MTNDSETRRHSREGLTLLCSEWSAYLRGASGEEKRISFFRNELPSLLLDEGLFERILSGIAGGDPFPDTRRGRMFENELVLYIDPGRRFSLRMFLYEPREYTPIHDHSSWGVSGAVSGSLSVVRYRRLDDGTKEGHAALDAGTERLLSAGETEVTLPLDRGIHRTGASGSSPLVMVSVYGPPLRRLFINLFDPENRRVTRLYPQKIRMKRLASSALEGMRR